MRSGFVAILGRPNVGKSTLVNALVGERVSIVTSKPQTTRNRILGVVEAKAVKGHRPAAQVVFVDTPGVHKPGTQLDRRMMQAVYEALEERDLVLLVVDATRAVQVDDDSPAVKADAAPQTASHETAAESADAESLPTEAAVPETGRKNKTFDWRNEDEVVFTLVEQVECPVFLVLNKIDLVRREELLPLIERLTRRFQFAEVFPVSAKKRDGLEALLTKVVNTLPEGERYFPPEQYTDQPERFLVAELIRERILMETGEEVPYASAVVVETFEEPPAQKVGRKPRMMKGGVPAPVKEPVTSIGAVIYCERDGQKAILIGKGGEKLRAIGMSARKAIESLLGTRVFLDLRVIVEPGWRERKGFVEGLDWRRQLEGLSAKDEDDSEA